MALYWRAHFYWQSDHLDMRDDKGRGNTIIVALGLSLFIWILP
jgi:hypothetical protein